MHHLRIALVLTLLGGSIAASWSKPATLHAQTTDRPNIMLIVTDDQRDLMAAMPHTMQSFATEGRRYTNAYATTPLCCPSRASIFTGRYAHNHGVQHNGLYPELAYGDMLQAKLQEQGYRTGIFGKYLNAWPRTEAPPNFDAYAISANGYRDREWNVNGEIGVVPGYNTDIIGDKAIDFIQDGRGSDQPWMMVVTPYAPHEPFEPEPLYAQTDAPPYKPSPAMTEADRSDKPYWVRKQSRAYAGDGEIIREKQSRTLRSVDDMVYRIMSALRRTGQENTIAVFMSDNGFLWGEHGVVSKTFPYSKSVKVPMFIRWPGMIEGGTSDRRLTANIDLTPTFLSVVGVPADDRDGRNLFDPAWSRSRIHLEYWCNVAACNRWASTRTKTYQYIEHYRADGTVKFREYYDLVNDRWQLQNYLHDGLRRNNPDVAPLTAQLNADRTCVNAACP